MAASPPRCQRALHTATLLLALATAACRTPEAASGNEGSPGGVASDLQPLTNPAPPAADTTVPRLPQPEQLAGWVARPTRQGSITISHAFGAVVRSEYAFWGKEWQWAHADVTTHGSATGFPQFRARVEDLGLQIRGSFGKTTDREVLVVYEITATRSLRRVTGGGIHFTVNANALGKPPRREPELLDDNRGWAWSISPQQAIQVSFDPPIGKVYFERGNPSQIRCFLVAGDVEPGTHKVSMRVRLPKGGKAAPPWDYYYGPRDGPDWMPQTLDPGVAPVDVSFLNDGHRPAGKHGRLKRQGDALVFADGTPARFWGTNLSGYVLFGGSRSDIQREARRIAALGYNLARIHHHDSAWVAPNVFAAGSSTRTLDSAALDSLDWWIKCLRDEGIYVWIDLHVGREFRKGDRIDGFEELQRGNQKGFGFLYVNPTLEERWREFARSYASRKNRYTGLSLVDDPAVVAFLITNENDLTHHFGNLMLPDKNNPIHQRLFEKLVKQFASDTQLPLPGSLSTWEPGPAKIVLNELEHRFALRSINYLRLLGTKALVATTSTWGKNPTFSLPALATGDLIDVHSYGEADWLTTSPRVAANFASWIGAAQISGFPLSVSEWNVPPPARDRFVAPLYMASLAALQGWDLPMLYAYQQYPVGAQRQDPDRWSSSLDPALTALMPAAAVMLRQGHVQQANHTYRLQLSREQLYFQALTPESSSTIRTLVDKSRLVIGLPDIVELTWDGWANRGGAREVAITNPDRDFVPAGNHFIESDTGELRRDWGLGMHTINTPKSQAASGWLGGRRVTLADMSVEIETAKAVVAVTSLDSKPIRSSDRLLVTTVAQVTTSPGGHLPYRAQPVEGTIRIRTRHPSLCGYPVATDGQLFEPIETRSTNGHVELTLPKGFRTHWYVLYPKSGDRCQKRARFAARVRR